MVVCTNARTSKHKVRARPLNKLPRLFSIVNDEQRDVVKVKKPREPQAKSATNRRHKWNLEYLGIETLKIASE